MSTVSDFQNQIIAHPRILLKADMASRKTRFAVQELSKYGKVAFIAPRACIKNQTKLASKKNNIIVHQWDLMWKGLDLTDVKFVVIDEAQNLMSDATYMEAPFHLVQFIKRLPQHINLILMSANAERVKDFIEQHVLSDIFYLDISGLTETVKPKSIGTIRANQAWARLLKADANNKIIYFCDSTKDAYKLETKLRAEGIRAIASTSKTKNRTNNDLAQEERDVQNYIERNGELPEEVDVFITTSKNSIGLNIMGDLVTTVISELTDEVNLLQCSGRVRCGVREYLVVSNKGGRHHFRDWESVNNAITIVDALNKIVDSYLANESEYVRTKMLKDFQDMVKEKYGYLFIFFEGRYHISYGMIAEVEALYREHRRAKDNLDQVLREIVPCEDKDAIFHSIVAPYLNCEFKKSERSKLIEKLNWAGFPGRRLKDMVAKYGYTTTNAKDRSTYSICPPAFESCTPISYIDPCFEPETQDSGICSNDPIGNVLPFFDHNPTGSVGLNTNSELNVLASDPNSSHVSSFIEPAV